MHPTLQVWTGNPKRSEFASAKQRRTHSHGDVSDPPAPRREPTPTCGSGSVPPRACSVRHSCSITSRTSAGPLGLPPAWRYRSSSFARLLLSLSMQRWARQTHGARQRRQGARAAAKGRAEPPARPVPTHEAVGLLPGRRSPALVPRPAPPWRRLHRGCEPQRACAAGHAGKCSPGAEGAVVGGHGGGKRPRGAVARGSAAARGAQPPPGARVRRSRRRPAADHPQPPLRPRWRPLPLGQRAQRPPHHRPPPPRRARGRGAQPIPGSGGRPRDRGRLRGEEETVKGSGAERGLSPSLWVFAPRNPLPCARPVLPRFGPCSRCINHCPERDRAVIVPV